jgi:tol-pal system protein YbgF
MLMMHPGARFLPWFASSVRIPALLRAKKCFRLPYRDEDVMKKLLVGISALAIFALTAPVVAQTADVQSLSRELERLRNDLVDLQRFVYAGEGEVLVVPSAGTSADSAAVQLGIQQLEEKLRLLTGRVEDLEYQQRQLNTRMDTLVADMEGRLAAGVPLAASTANEDIILPADGGLTDDDLTAGVAPEAGVTATTLLPPGNEMDQYNFAFSLLRKADYEGAEIAFSEFITVYPDSELNGNAYYWLGSTNFVRDDFQNAAIAFLKGYQFDATGPKAADNLLKLGVTLSRLGKNAEACATFGELENKFPEAAQTLLDEASDEAAAAGCG